MSDLRWGILGAAKFAREFTGPALTLAPGGNVAALAIADLAKAGTQQMMDAAFASAG